MGTITIWRGACMFAATQETVIFWSLLDGKFDGADVCAFMSAITKWLQEEIAVIVNTR